MDLYSKELIEMLQCQVCWERLIRPIYRCQNEHLMCQDCRNSVTKCPSCRCPLGKMLRSLSMEQVADVVRAPCVYSEVGCPELLKLDAMRRHEAECHFAPDATADHCPLIYTCHWAGSRADVERHVRTDHRDELVISPDGVVRADIIEAQGSWVTIAEFDSALFVIRAECVPVADFTSHYVHVGRVAQGLRAAEARYRFKVREYLYAVVYKGPVTDYRQTLEDLAAAGGCLFYVGQAGLHDKHNYTIYIKKIC